MTRHVANTAPHAEGLAPGDTRGSCGVGIVADLESDGSHRIVADGLSLLERLEHRGTTGAESNTGDGAGIMLRTPDRFFREVVDVSLPATYAAGTLFLPRDEPARERVVELVETALARYELEVVTWRRVPTDNRGLGETALASEPAVHQCFVVPATDADVGDCDAFDRRLYVARRKIESELATQDAPGTDDTYVCSLDRETIVYKGLLTGAQLSSYYPDLTDDRVESTFVMVHERFSTNTLGAWHLAHPLRRTIHNGEFNTLRGNVNWMRARETELASETLPDIDAVTPIVQDDDQSDTACLDNVLELLLADGRSLPHCLRLLVPEAWRKDGTMAAERREWYDFHASLVEPWDGPALVAATDGTRIATILDRNGLRPCRYEVTTDGRAIVASESGALDLEPDAIADRGRLEPGELLVVDPEAGRLRTDDDVFDDLVDDRYGRWVDDEQRRLEDLSRDDPERSTPMIPPTNLRARQAAFGYTHDELETLVEPMARTGADPVGSMGDDTPLSVLASVNRPLPSYFRQLFAQVTNPPLDYVREDLVTSLECRLGRQRNLLAESPAHARQLVLDSPILTENELATIRGAETNGLAVTTVDTTFSVDSAGASGESTTDGDQAAGESTADGDPAAGSDPAADGSRVAEDGDRLDAAVDRLQRAVVDAIEDGNELVILSDRAVGPDRAAIPSLLAVSAVHQHLVREGLRTRAGLVVESGDPRTVHQVATLIGYGAGAVCPTLAFDTIRDLTAGQDGADAGAAIDAYVGALEDGLSKTMAKMGISTVESYRGAQIFEAVGLADDLVDRYFTGTESAIGGIGLADLEVDLLASHRAGFAESDASLERTGEFTNRSSGVHHQWNPRTVGALQDAVRSGDYERYRDFADLINDGSAQQGTLRGLLAFESDRDPIPLDEVEPVADVVERFSTAAMSLGSLSPEAHETNAIATNRIGAKANTGEGGEPPERFGTDRECAVKQVASGRFGVTSTYLAAADELQIKLAQGSKPGEGGHLPGSKVGEEIARIRKSTPGVGLISPPPLHDVYSIEDLKQLIFDLKAANEEADINVKLVSEAGIGTIAAGVAKANADVVHISGHSGGTGASPRTSIKHAGRPWELGLAEANQLLCETGLRDRIRVSVDGGLKTGRDVAVAALLGAEEYVFGTASLVSEGCVMARQCHENTCPVGIATQRGDLRERFPGEPEYVINYLTFVATELREYMARLGFETVEEMIGRVEVLQQATDREYGSGDVSAGSVVSAPPVDLTAMLAEPAGTARTKVNEQDHELDDHPDRDLIARAEPALSGGEPVSIATEIRNGDRAVGTMLSNRVASRHGEGGLPDGTISISCDGTAGQSFGAFLASGVSLHLTGVANDHVGKGLSGGVVTVEAPEPVRYDPGETVAIGNVALYGATDGECYVEGVAGERFAVRNSGAKAVVEGVGDHGCEYMTGGVVAVLGEIGRNFAAGMSGGVAYVYDPDGDRTATINADTVSVDDLSDRDETILRRLLENHVAYTDSGRGAALLARWPAAVDEFVVVMPEAYQDAIAADGRADVRTDLPRRPDPTQPKAGVDGVVSDD